LMHRSKSLLLLMLLGAFQSASAQGIADSTLLSQVETELTFDDSLSIFSLIDSLLQNSGHSASQLAVRMTYNSNVMSTGRTLGIQNFGLAPGISFYHKSGFYADVSGYWSKDFNPSYYLTLASLGYMKDFSRRFSLLAGYDHYLYRAAGDNYVPYRHAVSLTPSVELKPVSLSASYSFYFGDAMAHRIMPAVNLLLEKKKLLNIERVSVSPGFFLLLGNETITTLEYVAPASAAEAVQNFRKYGHRFGQVLHHKSIFGIMNYAFSIPLTINHRKWGFAFSYTYNIPKALPGEHLTLSESSYLSGSLTYFISLERDNLAL
jgi:hypothetical protein